MDYAGGFDFNMGSIIVRSPNITPDKETGIGNWTEELFLGRFRQYSDSAYKPHAVAAGEFQTVMPWTMYASMTDEDIKAIYAYLKTVKPVSNKVTKFEKTGANATAMK